jgi:hypothetical protein
VGTGTLEGAERPRCRRADAAGRLAEPEEIAGTVAFLASDDAGYFMGAGPEPEHRYSLSRCADIGEDRRPSIDLGARPGAVGNAGHGVRAICATACRRDTEAVYPIDGGTLSRSGAHTDRAVCGAASLVPGAANRAVAPVDQATTQARWWIRQLPTD